MPPLLTYPSAYAMRQRAAQLEASLPPAARALVAGTSITCGEDFLAFEERAAEVGRQLVDDLVECMMLKENVEPEFRRIAAREARGRYSAEGVDARITNTGPNPVTVQLSGGRVVPITTPYVRPSREGLVGRPREKRGASGTGRYPVLEKLGILDGVTPRTKSRIGQMTVLTGSYAEARDQLAAEGLDLDVHAMVKVAVATGEAALEQRNEALRVARESPLSERSLVAGQRIRISVDGGRARVRHTFTKRRKQKNGRRAFELGWREPRIITIDFLDDEGQMDRSRPPIYEVAVASATDVFLLMTGLLRLIGANQAAEVVFVADGAEWIWARAGELMRAAEIPEDRVRFVLDYYHATEHIEDALKACTGMPDAERTALGEELRRLLLQPGGGDSVIDRLSSLARGRRAAAIHDEIKYLDGHRAHMRYAELRAKKVPIGSGIVESAVRRVVNLRFKSASVCWREDHLGPLLYLRAIHKSGRWAEFMSAHVAQRHWLQPPPPTALTGETLAPAREVLVAKTAHTGLHPC